MNSENNHEIDQNFLMYKAFKLLLEKRPAELYDSIGDEGFEEIANFLTKISPEDRLNPSAMVEHIGEYCYQPGNEVLKKWYLKSYNSIAQEDIQAVLKKTGDAGDRPSMTSSPNTIVTEEVLQICEYMQHWAMELLKQNQQKREPELMERLAELLGGSENALIWLNSPHPVLDNRTPESYVQEGKLEVLEYFIQAIETGQPS
jgi:hypothetical protein